MKDWMKTINKGTLLTILIVSVCFATTSQALNEHLRMGAELSSQLKYTEAMDQFLQALLMDPENQEVRLKIREIGVALHQMQSKRNSLSSREHQEIVRKAWRKLNMHSPEEVRREYYLALDAQKNNRNLWAWEHFDRLTRMKSSDSRYKNRAVSEIQRVKEDLRKKIDSLPFTARNLYAQGFESYANGEYEKAFESWNGYLSIVEKDEELTGFLPRVKSKLDIQRAKREVERSLSQAELAVKEGRFVDARKALNTVLSIEHDQPKALKMIDQVSQQVQLETRIQVARDYFSRKDYVNTTKTLVEVLQSDPQNLRALALLDQVEQSYSRKMTDLLQRESRIKETQQRKGREVTVMPARVARKTAARQETTSLISETPPAFPDSQVYKLVDIARATAHYNRGLIAYAQGQADEAVREWQLSLQYNPDHEKAQRALERIRAELRTRS